MNYHIKEILLDEEFERYLPKTGQGTGKMLSNVSKINIFVGENNSGKSKFLRQLAAIHKLQFVPNLQGVHEKGMWKMVSGFINQFISNVKNVLDGYGVAEADNVRQEADTITLLETLEEGSTVLAQAMKFAERLSQLTELKNIQPRVNKAHFSPPGLQQALKGVAETCIENAKHVTNLEVFAKLEYVKLYIPTLRGLRILTKERTSAGTFKDLYQQKTIEDYFPKKPPSEIFTGQSLYDDTQRLLLGNLKDRKKIREFEVFLSRNFFENKPVALIPKLRGDVLDIKIGDEAERPIHLLGDGVQSIIVLTFPLFMNRDKKLLVFCEEPELYLHPGLQRVLLNTFCEFGNNQYFLTTHSNHFLDLTLDFKAVSVFTFQKALEASTDDERNATFHIENISNEDARSLRLLGVRNSSVFLSNCTIWVEGITDRRYFRKYLELYERTLAATERRFKEDLHYSFLEYGGANITHFSFLDTVPDAIIVERLCAKLFLITDQDNASGKKALRHEQLRDKLQQRYHCLKAKEVENLLSPKVLREVLKAYGETDFQDFKQADYKHEGLGAFIENQVIPPGKKVRAGKYSVKDTLRDKIGFCSRAIEAMNSFNDLSPEAQDIARRLHSFIADNNK